MFRHAFSAERSKEVVLRSCTAAAAHYATTISTGSSTSSRSHDLNDLAVAEIYDFRVTSQYCYIAWDFSSAISAAADPYADPRALRYTAEIAHALSIIHAAGIVHRDLKPGNVMLRDDGSISLIVSNLAGLRRGTRLAQGLDSSPASSGHAGYMSPSRRAARRPRAPTCTRSAISTRCHRREALRRRHDTNDLDRTRAAAETARRT
jgi:hypothetical protein